YGVLVTNLEREDDEFLAGKVQLLRSLLQERPGDARLLKEEVEWEPAAREYSQVYVRILGATGEAPLETPGMGTLLPANVFPEAGGELPGTGTEVRASNGALFRVVAARVAVGQRQEGTAVVQIALDRTREEDLLVKYRWNLWLALGAAL